MARSYGVLATSPIAVAAMLLAMTLTACGVAPVPPDDRAAQSHREAVVRAGDVTVRASVVPTAALNEAVARQYGIERSPRSVLLLVGVREGPERQETALPARIRGNVIDLRGVRQPLELREVRSGDDGADPEQALLDYVGIVRVTPPDTLRFDLEIVTGDGVRSELRFSRDVYPQ
ncbi:DUF4426 domain-containing protein [Luteimonas suaedae]|uniref:DUF4426 domain-containing protein n=1 Tax=Luteimonas suaedae TaxID=2605430 RepID=UPI001659A047|nr:DUF4426 domain-containing protein [Luteimonas suaedae]